VPSFSNTLEQAIHAALANANARRHELATLEHLLLALIDEPDAQKVMKACSVDLEELRTTLVNFIEDDLSTLVTDVEGSEAVPTAAFQRVIQRAAIHVQSSGRTEVTGANVLVAIFAERESNAAYFLQEQDMTRYDAVNFIAHGVAKDPSYGETPPRHRRHRGRGRAAGPAGRTPTTANRRNRAGQVLRRSEREGGARAMSIPLIGRDHEVERCIQVLCRRRKNNPLLWAIPASARPPSPRGWPRRSSRARRPRCCRAPRSIRSTWARFWPAPAIAAISRNG
jgi:ATP-dependent Clp protease ATP-binding subunit ClpA